MTNSKISTLISNNEPLPAGLTTTGYLDLRGYAHALPAGLTTTGYLYLRGYAHALPAGLKHKETRTNLENLKEA